MGSLSTADTSAPMTRSAMTGGTRSGIRSMGPTLRVPGTAAPHAQHDGDGTRAGECGQAGAGAHGGGQRCVEDGPGFQRCRLAKRLRRRRLRAQHRLPDALQDRRQLLDVRKERDLLHPHPVQRHRRSPAGSDHSAAEGPLRRWIHRLSQRRRGPAGTCSTERRRGIQLPRPATPIRTRSNFETFDISSRIGSLHAGTNLLAIQGPERIDHKLGLSDLGRAVRRQRCGGRRHRREHAHRRCPVHRPDHALPEHAGQSPRPDRHDLERLE